MAVGGVVVDDLRQMVVRLAVDQAQQVQPLLVPVPRLAHRDHGAVDRVERDEQRRRPMALVAVTDRGPPDAPFIGSPARQDGVKVHCLRVLLNQQL